MESNETETTLVTSVEQARNLNHADARKQLALVDAAMAEEHKRHEAARTNIWAIRQALVETIAKTEAEHLASEPFRRSSL